MPDYRNVDQVSADIKRAFIDSGTLENNRTNIVGLSTGSFGGLGLEYEKKVTQDGRGSVGVGIGTGGILGSAPSGTIRGDYRFARGDLDTGSKFGVLRGELGAAILAAASPDSAAAAALITTRVTHLNSGVNASLDFGAAAVSPFDDGYRSYQPQAQGVAIFKIGKSF